MTEQETRYARKGKELAAETVLLLNHQDLLGPVFERLIQWNARCPSLECFKPTDKEECTRAAIYRIKNEKLTGPTSLFVFFRLVSGAGGL